jgi:hypothetical protein
VRLMWAGVALFVVVVAAFFGPAIVQRAFTQAIVPRPASPRRPRSRREEHNRAVSKGQEMCRLHQYERARTGLLVTRATIGSRKLSTPAGELTRISPRPASSSAHSSTTIERHKRERSVRTWRLLM